ncbi:MAG: hypothetical protein Q8S73_36105 [Deltaproteobacteria bacterium]|jgi:hypothetical protein|nr:hypothetical protein [Myxococcales bacterium]MDP3219582.1 hypothetical protein [Deltaproteobacteria bacterium]
MLKRLIIGILKGLILGGGMAVALYMLAHIGSVSGFWGYLLYGVLGAITGVVAGKPLWKPGAWIEALLRGVFGIAVGCGLYALGAVVLTGSAIDFTALLGSLPAGASTPTQLYQQPLIMAPMFATLYASLIELDNDGKGEDAGSTKVRVARLEDIDIGEDEAEAPAKPAARGAKR